jgi:ubiquitin-like 1-activating enzyme E1 B
VAPDWDDNLDRTLGELGVKNGGFLTITDEEEEYGPLALALCPLP